MRGSKREKNLSRLIGGREWLASGLAIGALGLSPALSPCLS